MNQFFSILIVLTFVAYQEVAFAESLDCGPGLIYYPPIEGCFRPYRRGPCREGYYLRQNKVSSRCVGNPCKEGFARYKGKCHELGKSNGPCPSGEIFDVNPTTLLVECLKESSQRKLTNNPDNCPEGYMWDPIGKKCRENWNV